MNLERIILQNLARVSPRLMTVGTLWSEVHLDDNRASYGGFKMALHHLEEKEQVVVVTGEDRDKVKITAAGLARLAE
jgi:hypothetical protein